jgi:uroporphyrin-III C-methyltransferase/precorrin-2 dehydrogenase/sirohydrochlorin ferrochelatase
MLEGDLRAAGVVHLVGAGPGDPELLTLKALRVLQDADIVFHDRLVDTRVMDLIRRDAERVFVGKARGLHAVPQRDIEQRLIEEARNGRRVVRLKGGDPFVFGRGGEELEALRAAGVEAHVVPGITAALGAAASVGAPLTHRDLAHAVTFISGRGKGGAEAKYDWRALAAANHTLVVYMGVDTAGDIGANLIEAGRAASTPLVIVENATTLAARHVKCALGDLAALIARENIDAPSIIIIGEAAALASEREIAALAESAA